MNTTSLKREIAEMLNCSIEGLGDMKFLKKPLKVKKVPTPTGKHYEGLKGECWEVISHMRRSKRG